MREVKVLVCAARGFFCVMWFYFTRSRKGRLYERDTAHAAVTRRRAGSYASFRVDILASKSGTVGLTPTISTLVPQWHKVVFSLCTTSP